MKEPKKRGRPAKPKGERAPTVNFTMRLRPALLEELRIAAERGQRSITGEAERRLSQPEVNDVGRMVAAVVDAIEARAGRSIREDESVRRQCRAAVDFAVDVLLGPPVAREAMLDAVTSELEKLKHVLTGNALIDYRYESKLSYEEIEAKVATLEELSDAIDLADSLLGPVRSLSK